MSFKLNERVFYYKDLAGVYLVKDLTNGKQYVGSSKQLDGRLRDYEVVKKVTPFLKHGNYFVGVIEFCSPEIVRERELHHILNIDTAHPKGYNKRCPITNKNLCNLNKPIIVKVKHKNKQLPFKDILRSIAGK